MSQTCKLETFHEYKALISFKFENKDSMIRKTFWKSTFDFLAEFPYRKGKISCRNKLFVVSVVSCAGLYTVVAIYIY